MTVSVRIIEEHGEVFINPYGEKATILNHHWIVNGKRFDTKPTEEQVNEAYKE